MKKIILGSVICSSLLLAANSDYNYEITPMIGGAYTEGNLNLDRDYANIGLSLARNMGEDCKFDQIELGILRTISDVDYENTTLDTAVTRLFVNGIKEYELNTKSSVYALVGAGYEMYSEERLNNEDGGFANYGVGYKYTFENAMSLKADLRHIVSFDGADNNLLYTVGLAIPFGKKAMSAPVSPTMEKEEPIVLIQSVKPKDSDMDGVLDPFDKCPDSMSGASVDSDGCAVVVDLDINFDINSSVITKQYQDRIKEFAEFLNSNPKLKATIEGHTDSIGSEKYNQWLSEKRAKSAAEAIESYNVDPSKLSTVGYGESKPLATNKTKEGRAENRRIQAVISK